MRKDSINADSVVPDCILSASKVHTQVTRAFPEKEHNLYILALVPHTPQATTKAAGLIESPPSWVPDFFSGETTFPFSTVNAGHQYTAGYARPMQLLPAASPQALCLQGINLDTVQRVGPSVAYVHGLANRTDLSRRAVLQWCIGAGTCAPTLAATLTATLTAGNNKDENFLSQKEKYTFIVSLVALLEDVGLDLPESQPVSESCSLSRDAG